MWLLKDRSNHKNRLQIKWGHGQVTNAWQKLHSSINNKIKYGWSRIFSYWETNIIIMKKNNQTLLMPRKKAINVLSDFQCMRDKNTDKPVLKDHIWDKEKCSL